MPAYMMLFVEDVTDVEALNEYRRIGVPTLADRDVKFLVRFGEFELLEGPPVKSVMMLEFPTMEDAMDWYNSPTYQAALTERRKGVKCHAVMVQGT
jgi:uncharacterized protein (DUF1330 family)